MNKPKTYKDFVDDRWKRLLSLQPIKKFPEEWKRRPTKSELLEALFLPKSKKCPTCKVKLRYSDGKFPEGQYKSSYTCHYCHYYRDA